MKVEELVPKLDQQQLDEIKLKHALAIGALAASAAMPINKQPSQPSAQQASASQNYKQDAEQRRFDLLVDKVMVKYHVKQDFAEDVVNLALKYEKPDFPKASDILAIISIESSFDPKAVSRLKKDPAIGLMQVRPKVWGIDADELKNSIEKQISMGTEVLHKYHLKLNAKEKAVEAYNVGLSNFKKGIGNKQYVAKFKKALEYFV